MRLASMYGCLKEYGMDLTLTMLCVSLRQDYFLPPYPPFYSQLMNTAKGGDGGDEKGNRGTVR